MSGSLKKHKFKGELLKIIPAKLLADTEENNDFDDFFLTLSLIYNDIKNIHIFSILTSAYVEEPEKDGISYHRGEYTGVYHYLIRLLMSTLNEFFVFLEKNKSISESTKFKLLLKKLPNNIRLDWGDLYNIATKKISGTKKSDPILQILYEIRSNVTSHYWGSPEYLSKGFKKFFYKNLKAETNKNAYYSFATNMEETRFFYADAAVSAYIESVVLKHNFQDSGEVLKKIIRKTNIAIKAVMNEYIKNKL